jgi:4-amino-4-deoxy-L-arabinose transferase-like glycosyltransferase
MTTLFDASRDQPVWAFFSHRCLWGIAGLILLSRLLLLYFAVTLCGDDGRRYLQEAANLANHGVFSDWSDQRTPQPTAHDLPMFPLFMAAILRITGRVDLTTSVTACVNALLYAWAVVGIYGLAFMMLSRWKVALCSAIVAGIIPEGILYSILYMPESFFLALFIWANVFLMVYLRQGGERYLLAAFALLGLAVLAKPIGLPYAIVMALLVLVFGRNRRLLGRIGLLTAAAVVFLLVLSPWIVRNYLVFGKPALSTVAGTHLFDWAYADMLADMPTSEREAIEARTRDEVQQAEKCPPFERSEALGRIARREIIAHLSAYARTTLKRHPRLYAGTGTVLLFRLLNDEEAALALQHWSFHPVEIAFSQIPLRARLVQLGSWALLALCYLAVLVGAAGLVRRRQWFALTFLLLGFSTFSLVLGPVVTTRYRLVLLPFLSILAGSAVLFFENHRPELPG